MVFAFEKMRSPLPLLVARILAHNTDHIVAADDLAAFA